MTTESIDISLPCVLPGEFVLTSFVDEQLSISTFTLVNFILTSVVRIHKTEYVRRSVSTYVQYTNNESALNAGFVRVE